MLDYERVEKTKEEHKSKLNENLLRFGFEAKQVPSDGNCLFESLSADLKEHTGQISMAADIRRQVCNHIEANPLKYKHLYAAKNVDRIEEELKCDVEKMRSSVYGTTKLGTYALRRLLRY